MDWLTNAIKRLARATGDEDDMEASAKAKAHGSVGLWHGDPDADEAPFPDSEIAVGVTVRTPQLNVWLDKVANTFKRI